MSILFVTYPIGTRVTTPGGVEGTVVRVSPSLKKWPIVVKLDTGSERSFAPKELTIIATPAPHPRPYP